MYCRYDSLPTYQSIMKWHVKMWWCAKRTRLRRRQKKTEKIYIYWSLAMSNYFCFLSLSASEMHFYVLKFTGTLLPLPSRLVGCYTSCIITCITDKLSNTDDF